MTTYVLPHSARFYADLVGSTHMMQARWVAGWILAHGHERVTARDVGRAYRELRSDHAAIARVMETLTVAGWTVPLDAETRRTPTRWRVNPAIYAVFAQRAELERRRREQERARIAEAVATLGLERGDL
jgi:hypothetical protein